MYILNMLKRNTLLIALILVMILFEIAIQSTVMDHYSHLQTLLTLFTRTVM